MLIVPGMMVSEANCHPFQFGKYLWMHNGIGQYNLDKAKGGIADFKKIARRARESLREEVYDFIQVSNMS